VTEITFASLNAAAALPEIILTIGVCALLIIDGLSQGKRLGLIHNASVALSAALGLWCLCAAGDAQPALAFSDMYVNDSMGLLLKGFTCLAVSISLVYARQYAADRDMLRGEFYGLALFALLGQMVMISANTFLLIYLGLELLSLSLYAAVAMRRDHFESSEAAMKYFILGALASGFLLYGMSMVYGATGSLELSAIAKAAGAQGANKLILVFGLVFLVSGLAFKLGVVPFHMWVPDVYQGSPTAVTLLISAAPKLAAFSMLMRILVDGLLSSVQDWQQMLMLLSVLSMGIGNLAAIAQTNLKRMLAYSTIAQMGFMLLGMMSGVVDKQSAGAAAAYSASMFYVVTYVLTTLGTFGVILLLSRKGLEAENITDLNGLNARAPWMALVMLVLMFSLAGVPPMVGFYAKLAVLQAVFAAGHVTVTVYAVMMSLIGAFYYLRVVKAMYFEAPTDALPPVVGARPSALLGLNGAAIVVLGILPAPLMALCLTAIQRVLGS
jgi:NADH-quinone oxidoreductase subunit N